MKLIIAIVSNDDYVGVSESLMEAGFRFTRLSTTGGFLKAGNSTLMIGTEDENVEKAIEVIKTESKQREEAMPVTIGMEAGSFGSYPVNVKVGGATIFVIDVDQFYKF